MIFSSHTPTDRPYTLVMNEPIPEAPCATNKSVQAATVPMPHEEARGIPCYPVNLERLSNEVIYGGILAAGAYRRTGGLIVSGGVLKQVVFGTVPILVEPKAA